MKTATLLAASAVTLHGPALLLSHHLDRVGVPAVWDDQTATRPRGSLRPRLPRIALNLAVLYGLAVLGLECFGSRFPAELPGVTEGLGLFAALVLVDDLWFYGVHRMMHASRRLYRAVHKTHHEAFAPVPIEYLYVHPLEWMIGAGGAVLLIAAIVSVQGQMNGVVLVAWQTWRTLHEMDIHSGLRSPLTRWLPFWGGMKHHDLHHARPTRGNFASSFTIWDHVFQTVIRAEDAPPGAVRAVSSQRSRALRCATVTVLLGVLWAHGARAEPSVGAPMPSFRVSDLGGARHSERDLVGQWTVALTMTDKDVGDDIQRWWRPLEAALPTDARLLTFAALDLFAWIPTATILDQARDATPRTRWGSVWFSRDGSFADALGLPEVETPWVFVINPEGRVVEAVHARVSDAAVRRVLAALPRPGSTSAP